MILEGDIEAAGLRAKNAFHQVVTAKSGMHHPEQGRAPLLNRTQRSAWLIHRQIQQDPGLHVLFGFLTQGDGGTEGRHPAVDGLLHGGTPHRLAEHVVAQHAAVTPIQRADVVDQQVLLALSRWEQTKIRATASLLFGHKRLKLIRLHITRPGQGLNTGVTVLQLQLIERPFPLLAGHMLAARHQPRGAAQDHLIGLHAADHPLTDVLRLLLETLLTLLMLAPLQRLPLPERQTAQADQQNQGDPQR